MERSTVQQILADLDGPDADLVTEDLIAAYDAIEYLPVEDPVALTGYWLSVVPIRGVRLA